MMVLATAENMVTSYANLLNATDGTNGVGRMAMMENAKQIIKIRSTLLRPVRRNCNVMEV